MKVTINVTAAHIQDGHRFYVSACPIALAIRELGFPRGFAGPSMLQFEPGLTVTTPNEIRDFMAAFDAGHPVQPFSFTLEIPDAPVPCPPQA